MKLQKTLQYSEAMGMASEHIRMPERARTAAQVWCAVHEPTGRKSRTTLCKMIQTLREELVRVKGKK